MTLVPPAVVTENVQRLLRRRFPGNLEIDLRRRDREEGSGNTIDLHGCGPQSGRKLQAVVSELDSAGEIHVKDGSE